MGKESTDVTTIEDDKTQLPAFMEDDAKAGTEDLGQYVIPPRIKVIQKSANNELLEKFSIGDVVIVPQKVLVAHKENLSNPGERFSFTPIFFFTEWVIQNPFSLKAQLDFIVGRTFDPDHEIARKARDSELRSEKFEHTDGKEYEHRYVENLNFIVLIHESDITIPCVLSFAKASHKQGRNLASLITMRKSPIFGCVFDGIATNKSNEAGEWVSIDCENPVEMDPFIQDKDEYESYKALHLEYKAFHEKAKIRVDYDDDADTEVEAGAASKEF